MEWKTHAHRAGWGKAGRGPNRRWQVVRLDEELRRRAAAPAAAAPAPVPVEKRVEVPVEKRVEVPVERVVEKRVEVPVERVVDKERVIEKRVEVPVEVPVDRVVEVPIEKRVEVPVDRVVEVPVDRVVEKERVVEVTVERAPEPYQPPPQQQIYIAAPADLVGVGLSLQRSSRVTPAACIAVTARAECACGAVHAPDASVRRACDHAAAGTTRRASAVPTWSRECAGRCRPALRRRCLRLTRRVGRSFRAVFGWSLWACGIAGGPMRRAYAPPSPLCPPARTHALLSSPSLRGARARAFFVGSSLARARSRARRAARSGPWRAARRGA